MALLNELDAIADFVKCCGWDVHQWHFDTMPNESEIAWMPIGSPGYVINIYMDDVIVYDCNVGDFENYDFKCSMSDPDCFEKLKKELDSIKGAMDVSRA